MCSLTMRPATSVGPPAANGTITVIGRVGQAWAIAVCGRAGSVAAPAASCRNRRRGSLVMSTLCWAFSLPKASISLADRLSASREQSERAARPANTLFRVLRACQKRVDATSRGVRHEIRANWRPQQGGKAPIKPLVDALDKTPPTTRRTASPGSRARIAPANFTIHAHLAPSARGHVNLLRSRAAADPFRQA
jgi:hypothetical protein